MGALLGITGGRVLQVASGDDTVCMYIELLRDSDVKRDAVDVLGSMLALAAERYDCPVAAVLAVRSPEGTWCNVGYAAESACEIAHEAAAYKQKLYRLEYRDYPPPLPAAVLYCSQPPCARCIDACALDVLDEFVVASAPTYASSVPVVEMTPEEQAEFSAYARDAQARVDARAADRLAASESEASSTQHQQVDLGDGVLVDEGLVHLLWVLNQRGYQTTYSCQGDVVTKQNAYVGFVDLAHLDGVVRLLAQLAASGDREDIVDILSRSPQTLGKGYQHTDSWEVAMLRGGADVSWGLDSGWRFFLHFPADWVAALNDAARAVRTDSAS